MAFINDWLYGLSRSNFNLDWRFTFTKTHSQAQRRIFWRFCGVLELNKMTQNHFQAILDACWFPLTLKLEKEWEEEWRIETKCACTKETLCMQWHAWFLNKLSTMTLEMRGFDLRRIVENFTLLNDFYLLYSLFQLSWWNTNILVILRKCAQNAHHQDYDRWEPSILDVIDLWNKS